MFTKVPSWNPTVVTWHDAGTWAHQDDSYQEK